MTEDLRGQLLASLDKEARRFAADHPGDETGLYERAIAPGRRARRMREAAVGIAATAVLAVGAYALFVDRAPMDPAPPAPPVPETTLDLRLREWEPPATLEPDRAAEGLVETFGLEAGAVPGCDLLDAYARLEAAADRGGAPVALGAVVTPEGGANVAVARRFASEDDATAYLGDAATTARACADEAAAAGLAVTVGDVGLATVAGEGLRVEVTEVAEPDVAWTAWIHVRGDEALAVTVEPGARDLAGATIVAWFVAAG
ncbi:hypothetical protein [Demequina pelophila]|uniref:hypothetical protein n=1 Tax=Demequina pelophila TaxID=1638984 RepID=UPI0007848BFC|nr:hypothetical protein [Demequina pelophila]